MKKMNKNLVLVLVIVMLFSSFNVALANSNSIDAYYLDAIDLGEPIEKFNPKDCTFDVYQGKDIMYSTSDGDPAVLNVFNIDDKELISSHKLPGASSSCRHIVDSKHRVYIVTSPKLFRYDPATDTVEDLGNYSKTETTSFIIDKDEHDNIYIGTYPNAKVIKFDAETEAFIDFGKTDPTAKYVRSLAYHDGYIYAGTFSEGPGKLYKINAKNPSEKQGFDLPRNDAVYKLEEAEFLYCMNMADDLLVIYLKTKSKYAMVLFDTKRDEFINDYGHTGTFTGLFTSEPKDNLAYFLSNKQFYTLNTKTARVEATGFHVEAGTSLIGSGWVTLENYPDFPGKTLATVNAAAEEIRFYNMETKKTMSWKTREVGFKGGKIKMKTVTKGPNGEVYASGRAGMLGVRFNPSNGQFTILPIGGAEGSIMYKDKQYYGIYTGGHLWSYDPNVPIGDSNPKHLAQVGEEQDRPFALDAGDDKIFLGTVCGYGKLGGAISIYDLKTEKISTIRNIVQDQSVIGIAYKDGKLYGSTTIHGGLGSTATAQQAKMFVYDIEKGEKIKEFTPNIPGLNNPLHIGELKFDKNGKLWAASGYTIFSIDMETEKVSDVKSFGTYDYKRDEHTWKPIRIRFDKKGYLYANLNGLKAINTKDMSFKELTSYEVSEYDIGDDNNLYFAHNMGSHFKVIPIFDTEITKDDINSAKELLSDKLSMAIDRPLAVTNGIVKYIDENNENVTPIVQNGRTLVPVRFIADSLGASVNWDDATQTVMLNKKGLAVSITLGESEIIINGVPTKTDVPATTKDGRTLLPLRAVSDAFSKQLFWDDRGIIVMSDKAINPDETMKVAIDTYLKFYVIEKYNSQVSYEEGMVIYNGIIDKLNGRRIEIPNSDFEEPPTDDDPVPNFTPYTEFVGENAAYVTNERAFSGEQSLKVIDTSREHASGYVSEFIPVDSSKKLKLVTPLFIDEGGTSILITTYDENKKLIANHHFDNKPPVGVWNFIESDIPLKASEKFIKISLYTTPYWVSISYYDNLTLIEY